MITFNEAPRLIPSEDRDWWPGCDDREKAKRWCALSSIKHQPDNYGGWSEADPLKWNPASPALSSEEREEWAQINWYFLKVWIARLQRGEFVAEGYRFGETQRTKISPEFWLRHMSLDMWNGTSEWNGIKYIEIKVGRPTVAEIDRPPSAAKQKRTKKAISCPDGVFQAYLLDFRADQGDEIAVPDHDQAWRWAKPKGYSRESVRALLIPLIRGRRGRRPKRIARE